jgi:hypothetical protein
VTGEHHRDRPAPAAARPPAVVDDPSAGPLLTEAQLAAERAALAVAAAPEVADALAELRPELAAGEVGRTADGQARLDRALQHWARSLAFRHASSDPSDTAFVWSVDETPRSSPGHAWPGAGIGGVGNPDNVYRSAFLDGRATYEVTGRRAPNGSAHFSLEVAPQEPGGLELVPVAGNEADLGTQLGILTVDDLEIDADGVFRVTVGPDAPSDGRTHIRTRPGHLAVTHRDTLTDWSQAPNALSIRRVAGDVPADRPDLATLVARTIETLPGWIGFWGAFRGFFLGVPEPNRAVDPLVREGGWGLASGGRFSLGPDDVLLVTTARSEAVYAGFQVADPWMMVDDPRNVQLSLNGAQVDVSPDGTITHAIAPRDPGLANWLDTGGTGTGWFMLRWQWSGSAPSGPDGLVLDSRVVDRADLDRAVPAGVARVGADERAARLRARRADYDARLGPAPTR